MGLSKAAINRLKGLWGGYDFTLIRDNHFLTSQDIVEKFIEKNLHEWEDPFNPLDVQYNINIDEVRDVLNGWAADRLERIINDSSSDTVRSHIMFKQISYSNRKTINFGSTGTNWHKKTEIAIELRKYRPWSINHCVSVYGNKDSLYRDMCSIVKNTGSPTELKFFISWWGLSKILDRPMLFPQVHGHTSGKFWMPITKEKVAALHFDFGLVNVITRKKIIIECDSRMYHSKDPAYQNDRDRQNIAEREGWSVRRFTYEDVMNHIDSCFDNIENDLYYGKIK